MAEQSDEELLRQLEYGTGNQRIQALISLAGAALDLEVARRHLYPLAGQEVTDEQTLNERLWALIALASLGDRDERVRESLLDALRMFAAVPESRTPLGLVELQIGKAMSLFKDDERAVTEIRGILNLLDLSATGAVEQFGAQNVLRICLTCLGAIGHESARGILEYWHSRGNVTASAALELFGESWDTIRTQDKKLREKAKG